MIRAAAFAVLTLLAILPAQARDIDGVKIPDTLTLAGEKKPLVLNGAGYRKKLFVKVYIGALYLSEPIPYLDRILDATTPRVMHLHFVREVGADKMADAWRDGFAANHSTFEMRALSDRLAQFNRMMQDMKTNDVLRIELLPRGDTRVWINDAQRGTVQGADFQRALLRVWLGNKPADTDLKQALLGAKAKP
jgi:long-chain acyl-CoA synthetase